VAELKDNPAALRQAVNEHITSLVGRYRGKLKEWDVINEPYTNRDLEISSAETRTSSGFKLATPPIHRQTLH